MTATPEVQPLSHQHRTVFFYLLLGIFLISLPLFFLYATGYRFHFGEENTIVSTGGMYVAAERTGAAIYIDNELVRETRVFRRAFYAQSLAPGTHRVHVQKKGHHTWVKELPVYAHIVTEAQAFNLPLEPDLRIISPWQTIEGESVLWATSTVATTTTNPYLIATSTATTTLIADTEYQSLIQLFATSTATSSPTLIERVSSALDPAPAAATTATSTRLSEAEPATTTVVVQGVRLFEQGSEVYAEFVGSREDMPYYYCAEDFELLGTSTAPLLLPSDLKQAASVIAAEDKLLHPVQQVAEDTECEQQILINRQNQPVSSFDFFPGSTDFVLMALENGVYVVEVDDRAWQNTQPLLLGANLHLQVENGNIYVYDGELIYHVQVER